MNKEIQFLVYQAENDNISVDALIKDETIMGNSKSNVTAI